MKENHKISLTLIFSVFILTVLAITAGHYAAREKLTFSLVQTASSAQESEISIEIPPQVNLDNFYGTFGDRIFGDEESGVKIISREEWGADNRYADLQFIADFCAHNYCYPDRYNPEDTFSEKEYWRSLVLWANDEKNFQFYDNSLVQKLTKENGVLYSYLPVEEIVVHHTAGKFTVDFEESKAELKKIYLMTAVQRKWQDIGYHYLIDGAGRIYEGNLGGKYAVGTHAYGHNQGTIAISFMGDFRPGHDEFNEKMQKSFVALVQYLIREYDLNATEECVLRRADLSGWETSSSLIRGHMELDIREDPTECPGVDPDYLRRLIYDSLNTSASY